MDTVDSIQQIQNFLYQDILDRLVDGATVTDYERAILPEISYLEDYANQIKQARIQQSIAAEAQPQDAQSLQQGQGRAEWIQNNALARVGADTVGATAIGALNMANDTLVGGVAGGGLAALGRGIEAISPFSGLDKEATRRLENLRALGAPSRILPSTRVYNDSWATKGAKTVLGWHNSIEDQLNALRTYTLGKDPSKLAKIFEGTGSSLGFILSGIAASHLAAAPILGAFLGAATKGGLEAVSEVGGFLGDAYRNGQYDDRTLAAAGKNFLANAVLNTGFEYAGGWFSPILPQVNNPVGQLLIRGLGEELNELVQEPSQHVIENAAKRSLEKGTSFWFDELPHGVMNEWWNTAKELAPEVAASTALTTLLLGLGGAYNNHRYNRDMRTKVPEAMGNLERQRTDLQSVLDNIPTTPYNTNVADARAQIIAEAQANATQQEIANAQVRQGKTPSIGKNQKKAQKAQAKARKWRLEHAQAQDQAQTEAQVQTREQTQTQLQGIDKDLQTLKDYAESSPAWVTRDAPQELYDALGKGEEGISMFADDEELRDDETPVDTQQETSTSDTVPDDLEGSHTKEQQLVDDEPDFDLEEDKDYNAATQEQQQDTQKTTSTTPQQNAEPRSMFDDLKGEQDNTQSLIDEHGKTFHQAAQNEDAGTFSFTTKGKSYKFGVTSTNSNGENTISGNRRNRYQGRRLEITNSRGQVIATYYPHLGRLDIAPETARKHSRKWLQSFKSQFMSGVDNHLGREGFLDANGNLTQDGNEAFRERWDKRRKSDANSFYDDVAYPEDAYDTQQGTQSKKGGILDSIRRAVNGEIFHQGDNQSENVRDTAQSGSTDANTFSVKDGEGRYTFKVRAGQFSDKHQRQKKFFGRFIELVDNAGNVIARYTPYGHTNAPNGYHLPNGGTVEFSKHAPKDEFTRMAIASSVDYNSRVMLANNGFFDAKGRLIDEGDKEVRKKEFERWGKIDEARRTGANMRREKAWREHRAKMSYGERLKEDYSSSWSKFKRDASERWHRGKVGLARAGRSGVYRAVQLAYDIVEVKGRKVRKHIRKKLNAASDKLIEASNFDKKQIRERKRHARRQNDALSRVVAAQIMHLASYTDINPMKLLNNRNFDIISDANPTANLDRKRETGEPKRNEFGNYKASRGDFECIPKGKLDRYGNAVDFARNIIYLYANSDVSTMIHEPGHFFLQVMRDLYRDGQLTGQALKDWNTLSEWLGMDGIDFKLLAQDRKKFSAEERTKWDENNAKWHDAQEKFATGAEKYVMAGQAPNMKLKRAFEVLRQYMSNVYASAIERDEYGDPVFDAFGDPKLRNLDDVIYYGGADDREHRHETTDEARAVMARIYGGTDNGEKRAAKTSSNTESASGDGETYHQNSLGRQKTIRDVLDIMQTEQGRKNAGSVWVDYARVSPEEAKRISEATGLDINSWYLHSIIGSAVIHTLNRHGVGNEQRQDQLPITETDFERIPDIISTPDEISRGTERTTGGNNDTIVYKKRINGHILVVEEVRTRKGKLAFHSMRKTKAGYDYDLSKEGHPIVKEKAKSEGVTSINEATRTVQLPNALSNGESVQSNSSNVNASNTETYHQSAHKRIRRSNNSFINPERYNQLVYHGTWHTILGNKFDLHRVGAGSGARLFGWGIYFSDSKDDVQKYRKAGRDTSNKKHGNIYVADIPENETLLNWNAKISEQTDIVKTGLRKAVVRAKQLGANDAVLRRLLTAKTGEEFYKTLENYVVPAIMHNLKGASRGFSNDMAASLLLNQAGIPGLYHANTYLDNAMLKPKHNRNFVIWNTDMIKLMSISQDSDFDAKNYFSDNASLSEKAEQLLDNVEKELASDKVEPVIINTKVKPTVQRATQAKPKQTADTSKSTQTITNPAPRRNEMVMRAEEFTANLTPEARKQTEAVRRKYFGTSQWMKAPNGKDTNLTEQQWLAVRTPNFKHWFGDWEHDPAHASKVLDENGEPLVVWHGSPKGGFSVFDTRGKGISKGSGAFFSSTRTGAEAYIQGEAKINQNLYPVFLNIRTPYVYDAQGRYWAELTDTWIEDRDGTRIYTKQDGTPFKNKYDAMYYIRNELHDERRYQAITGDRLNSTDDIIRAVWDGYMGNEDYDGVIIKNVLDGKGREPIDDYIIRTAENIKSATSNNGEYSESRDIFHQAVMRTDEFMLTPDAQKQMDEVRKQYESTSNWLKAPNGKKSNLTEQQWLAVRTKNFKRWFGDWENDPAHASKVLDENGEPKVVYHGTGRADRIGSIFDPKRATSGPMAFFTDSRQIAEGYSHSKADTSLSREGLDDYRNRFVVKDTKLIDYWYTLSRAKQERIAAVAPTITFEDAPEKENPEIISDPNNRRGLGGYEQHIRKAGGNHFAALIDEWLNSGTLFNQEEKFLDVLRLLGLDNVRYLDPYYREEAVYDTFMNLRNPFDTANISDSDLAALRRSAIAAERYFDPQKAYDSDLWDKTTISPMAWFRNLEEDIKNGTTFAWTQIPDFITNRLKKLGYDGIVDEGGKYHDEKHTVYIPFASGQIKSSTQNNGEYSHPRDIYHQAVDYVREFQNILANADPDKIDFGNLAHKSFISDERYHQDSWHGTGHTVEENRMKLSKVGTGERGQYRGWGIYSAQARGVAETYRGFGLPRTDIRTFSIILKDGTVIHSQNNFDDEILQYVINTLKDIIDNPYTPLPLNTQQILTTTRRYFSDLVQSFTKDTKRITKALDKAKSKGVSKDIKREQSYLEYELRKNQGALRVLDEASDIQLPPQRKGNIYRLDVPENDIILNWDASLEEQPEHVKQAIEKIKEFIHKQGKKYRIGTKKIDKANTGGALYMEIVNVMERYLARHTPDDGVTQAKKRTSLLFDRFGVPGLRFLDRFSRRGINDGKDTYNFVTWNEDYIKVLGIEPDSDTEAIEYFERYRAEHPDGFIVPEAIERFDQLVTHATGNIILGNKFDLRYVGSSEGGDMFGYGAYFEQSPEVAKSYRRYGLHNMGLETS